MGLEHVGLTRDELDLTSTCISDVDTLVLVKTDVLTHFEYFLFDGWEIS